MQFYNTGKIINGVGRAYSLQENSRFIADVEKATSISIVSAFYNIEYFKKLANYFNGSEVKVFIPAEKSITKLVKQRSILSDFIKDYPNFQFRLIDSGYLLHTKLYFIEQVDTSIVWIGSSNASTNSIERCEELMLRIPLDELPPQRTRYIINYINSLQEISFCFQERTINLTTSNLRHFFSQGHLYTKTSETFNPSIEIDFGEYRDRVMQALRANIEANSLTGLFIKTTSRISILELLKSSFPDKVSDIEATKGGGEGIKKFGLFTSYGLWIPDGYVQAANAVLETSENFKKREHRLTIIRELLENTDEIVATYKKILSEIARLIGKQEGLFFSGQKELYSQDDKNINIKRLKSKFAWCRKQLKEGNHFYNLLLYPYYSSPMPNIWDDNYAVSDFIESFYYSLITEHEKTQHRNLLYQSIQHFNHDDDSAFDYEELPEKEHLERLLTNQNDRMFCQYDLRDFFSYNESSSQYKFTQLSDVNDIKEGANVFYLGSNYFIYGPVIEIRRRRNGIFIRCAFEDDDQEEYNIAEHEKLYLIDISA